ncbi:hypothetical protein I4U23_028409 [Adineta vaga]|nr:hypothetical protein I4U23_028409 [Adineta vaga]
MAGDEKKLAASSLIPLEVDPASILSLSKGVIFDTIVHNIEYTLNNRRIDPLPWKLTGMSLICDPSRNKKYMQKLQKMQCVPSVICTQIYHSKLVKTETGTLTTPGRKILLRSSSIRRLTGIYVCRSIDELLFMEPSNTENVHYIQYKLLSYERLATRELVNGPKLTAVGDRVIKTVFDFELTQNTNFPRQLLPVAIISFSRETGCDLCGSIRHFLNLDDHKVFDKSYLVTSTNVEFDRLREEQERREDAEAEQEYPNENIQRRQPLADLSKKSTDTGNARPAVVPIPSSRVPPLKIKLPPPEKSTKLSAPIAPLDRKYHCSLKLDKINLSLYEISNLESISKMKTQNSTESTASSSSSDSTNHKTKSFTITKPREHHKSLKRLNTLETKKQSSTLSEISKEKRPDESVSIRSSTSDVTVLSTKEKNKERSISSSSLSSIYRSKPAVVKQIEKSVTKKKVKRPILPPEYRCSLSLLRIDLSMYDLDLPPPVTTSMNLESVITTSPSNSSFLSSLSSSSEHRTDSSNIQVNSENVRDVIQSTLSLEQDSNQELDEPNIFDAQTFDDINTNVSLPNIMDEFLTPDLNDALLTTDIDNDLSPTNEITLQPTDLSNHITSSLIYETVPETTEELFSTISNVHPTETMTEVTISTTNKIPMETTSESSIPTTNNEISSETIPTTTTTIEDEMETTDVQLPSSNVTETEITNNVSASSSKESVSAIGNEENNKSNSPVSCNNFSPTLPPLDDDPVLFAIESPQVPIADVSNPSQQEYLIIVPCSDDEDDEDDDDISINKINSSTYVTEKKPVNIKVDLEKNEKSPVLSNPLITRVLTNINRLNSDRLSISSSSSCSSISTFFLHNQSIQPSLQLTEYLLPQKILNKKQRLLNSSNPVIFSRFNISIPLLAHEPLIDPRLIYRLQAITTDLRWSTPCNQCSIEPISSDRKCVSDHTDPRRESLKNAILNNVYQRLKTLIPNIFITNSNEFQKHLFEQTIFQTNCSLHLEYLLQKIKQIDDMNFFQLIKTNEEFHLSPHLLQLIFN